MTAQASPAMRRFILFVDLLTMSIGKHWLLLVNFCLLVFVGLPMLAPVLLHFGYTGPADLIYSAYRLTCHQLAFRSYFFFGEQPVYTLDQLRATLAVQNEDVVTYWGNFLGNSQIGYKMAWCERNAAIYTSILLAGLAFGLVRTRLRALDWRIYLVLIAPMALDGFWQLFTSPTPILPFLPPHESDWLLRGITGTLFGAGSVWLIYPYLEEAMRDVFVQARAQYERIHAKAEGRAPLAERET